jgi:hypothetical protein
MWLAWQLVLTCLTCLIKSPAHTSLGAEVPAQNPRCLCSEPLGKQLGPCALQGDPWEGW